MGINELIDHYFGCIKRRSTGNDVTKNRQIDLPRLLTAKRLDEVFCLRQSLFLTNVCSMLSKPTLTDHPVDVGHRTEAAILAELVKRGYRVLLPFGVNQRYDLVVESDGRFLKVQCKTGRLRAGAIRFRSLSTQSNTRETRVRDYSGEVDLFAVYCPDNQNVYVIPAGDVPPSAMYLRVDPPCNKQRKRVRWARDYELPA